MVLSKTYKEKKKAEERIKLLADRAAILLVICNARNEDEWNPWMSELMYDGEGQLGDHVRKMADYTIAKGIVKLWLKKQDSRTAEKIK
jgi:hypothetical protein